MNKIYKNNIYKQYKDLKNSNKIEFKIFFCDKYLNIILVLNFKYKDYKKDLKIIII